MCGICGIISQNLISDTTPVKAMQDSLIHRGPDGAGEFYDKYIAMAMRRLSIIDLTGGWQPLYNEDKSLVLIANAEIYNYIELQNHLRSKGHTLRTGSDCEVILHLYEDHDIDCLNYLRGMFAFALWDKKKQRLMLARDRIGEKPLYLYQDNGRLIFASEIKALLRSGLIPFELDPVAIDLYFHYQFFPEPETPIKGIRKLEPGHFLTIDVNPWQMKGTCYWDMMNVPPLEGNPSEIIRSELETISELIIRSDVPIGIALSGGLDSSAIAALISQKYKGKIHAFSVGYPNRPDYDERSDAKALADYLKMPFYEIEITTEDMVKSFPELIYCCDDPIADPSSYCYYSIMKNSRAHNVPVMLLGQGGDELFWGYPWVVRAVYESIQKSYTAQNDNRLILYDLVPDFQLACRDLESFYTTSFKENLIHSKAFDIFSSQQPWSDIDIIITKLLCQTYLLENGIAQGDRLSMSSSVELRIPLVDYILVEKVIGLRKCYKDFMLEPKAWLKEALKGLLPDFIINRPKKGFQPPVHEWYRNVFACYGKALVDGYLVNAGIFKSEKAIELSLGIFTEGVSPLSFKALILELWSRMLLQKS